MQGFCFGPKLVEVDLQPEFLGPLIISKNDVALLVNGIEAKIYTIFSKDSTLSIMPEKPIKPSDSLHFKLISTDSFDSLGRQLLGTLIEINNAGTNALDSASFSGYQQNVISPVSSDPQNRSALSNATIIDSVITSSWSSGAAYASNNFSSGPHEFTRIWADSKEGGLALLILDGTNPGRIGERITFRADLRIPSDMKAKLRLVTDSGHTDGPELETTGGWGTHSVGVTLDADTQLALEIFAIKVDSPLVEISYEPYICVKNIEVDSNLRGVFFKDPTVTLSRWTATVSANPGSESPGSIASWREVFMPGDLDKAGVYISKNRLTIIPIA